MKYKYTVWILCGLLTLSVAANIALVKMTHGYVDDFYGELAKQHLFNSRLREYLLGQSDIEAARQLLEQEMETEGAILAICLMENCSDTAVRLMSGGR